MITSALHEFAFHITIYSQCAACQNFGLPVKISYKDEKLIKNSKYQINATIVSWKEAVNRLTFAAFNLPILSEQDIKYIVTLGVFVC